MNALKLKTSESDDQKISFKMLLLCDKLHGFTLVDFSFNF